MLLGGFVILPKRKVKEPTRIQKNLKLIVPPNFKLQATLESKSNFYDLACSPDGQMLASGSDDYAVRLWDAKSGKLIKTLELSIDELHINEWYNIVNAVAWSLDGQILASGYNNGIIRLWDVKTGKLIKALEGHTGNVNSVAWSPDGHVLASGSDDYTVRLWDA